MLIQRLIEVVRSIPTIPLWMALAAALPNTWSVTQVYIAITRHHLAGRLDRSRARGARTFPGVARGGFRHRRRARRGEPHADHPPPHAALLREPRHRRDQPRAAGDDRERNLAELPRPRAAPAGDQLGHPAAGCAEHAGAGRRAVAALGGGAGDRRRSSRSISWATGCATRPIRMADPVLSVRDLAVQFGGHHYTVQALDGVSLDLHRGRVLGVVGESGCGKSVTARAILRILDHAGRIVSGRVLLDPGTPSELDAHRARRRRCAHPRDPRRPHRADLPGADDRAQHPLHDRQPDHRGDPPARRPLPACRPREGDRPAARRRHPARRDCASTPIRSSSAAACASASASRSRSPAIPTS